MLLIQNTSENLSKSKRQNATISYKRAGGLLLHGFPPQAHGSSTSKCMHTTTVQSWQEGSERYKFPKTPFHPTKYPLARDVRQKSVVPHTLVIMLCSCFPTLRKPRHLRNHHSRWPGEQIRSSVQSWREIDGRHPGLRLS